MAMKPNGRVVAKKPLLMAINNKKRLHWARQHERWAVHQWKKILFSDESKFEVCDKKR